MIYLDHAAITPALPVAREAFANAPFGNPSSEHAAGKAARTALENARYTIAKCLDCKPHEIYFFSTASEASASVMNSLAKSHIGVIASPYEHHAISENIQPVSPDEIRGYAIAVQHSNNETGTIIPYPSDKLNNGVLFICDATSSIGHTELKSPTEYYRIDVLIADGIKFGGVPGAAFLICKEGFPLSPLIRGGGQERGVRSGTENVPAICAMAAALEWQCEHMDENTEKLESLLKPLYYCLSEIPHHKWNTPMLAPHLPHILNISFDGVDAHALALLLSQQGVMVSAGAACSNRKNEPSHVIMAMFNDEERARSAIRISLSHETTPDELNTAAKEIAYTVSYLRSL